MHQGHGHGRRGRGFRGTGGWQQADLPPADDAASWLAGRLPDDWFAGPPSVSVDREEIVVIGELPAPEGAEGDAAAEGRISRFREQTREQRMAIAREAEHRFGRKVAWGARLGESAELFTTLSVPVMTRLKQTDRQLLDTLVDAGVARSRSDALAWCVRQVGQRAESWLSDLRDAMQKVEEVRDAGPDLD